jgi:hypothetical protein
MKNPDSNADRDRLNQILGDWKVTTPLPPGFQEQVWSRIARTQKPGTLSIWTLVTHWIGAVLPRPALAASYVAVLLVIGVTAGVAQGRHETTRVKGELSQRYVRMLDPYQAASAVVR